MNGRAVGLCTGWLVPLVGLLAPPAAAAPADTAGTPAEVVVDCQELSADLRASLEARARADLWLKRLQGWQLRVVCEGERAAVEFTPAGRPLVRGETTLAGEPEDSVDRLLALVHEVAAVPEEAAPPSSVAELPVATAPRERVVRGPAPVEPTVAPRERALPANGHALPASAGAPLSLGVEPEASFGAELWPAEPLVLVGPALSVAVRLKSRLRLVPTASLAWSAGSRDVAVRSLEGGLDAMLGERFWCALGARVAWLRFEPRAALSPVSRTIVDPAFVARVGLSLRAGTGRASASLGARVYAERRDVRLDRVVALRVPNVAVLAALGYAAELL